MTTGGLYGSRITADDDAEARQKAQDLGYEVLDVVDYLAWDEDAVIIVL